MRKPFAVAAIALAGATAACSEARSEDAGPVVSRNYNVGNFSKIELAGRYDVEVRTGANPSVSARGPEKLMERLVVEVRGNELRIHPRKERRWFRMGWNSNEKIAVTVTVPALSAASLAGSGTVRVDRIKGERFEGEIAGSGKLRLGEVDVGLLQLGVAGSGDVDAGTGRARSAEYDIAGSGRLNAQNLATEDLEISIAGSGNVKARATRTADVDIVGSGNVDLAGGAKCNVSKAGSGNVRCS